MALPEGILGATYTHTDTENWFEQSWDHGIRELLPGQWLVTKSPRTYTIVRGGPTLFDNRDPGESGTIRHHQVEQAINRDCLLGACVQAHVPQVPLFSPEEISEPIHNHGGTWCTIALSHSRMKMPPFNFDEGSMELQSAYLMLQTTPGQALGMPTLDDETRAKYINYLKSAIDGIVFPNKAVEGAFRRRWALLNHFECRFLYDPDYPGGYTRLHCYLGMGGDGTTASERWV